MAGGGPVPAGGGGIFWAVEAPAALQTAASTRQLPIYSVERSDKRCAISFDAAWGDGKVRRQQKRRCFCCTGRRIFQHMTVQENLDMGGYCRSGDKSADIEGLFERFPRLKERRRQVAGTLSGGEQQMLAMGRALMSHPKLLMLDEPSMGLAPLLVEQIFDIIRQLHADGTTILLVEQNAQAALAVADRGYVLETGRIVTEGTGAALLESDAIKKSYLGG